MPVHYNTRNEKNPVEIAIQNQRFPCFPPYLGGITCCCDDLPDYGFCRSRETIQLQRFQQDLEKIPIKRRFYTVFLFMLFQNYFMGNSISGFISGIGILT